METLASYWSQDPCDPTCQSRLEASALWDSRCMEGSGPAVSCGMWTELSPHLQRNKQLHDTLLQREEELARLQEENHKLRQFLNSSFVKDLEEKAKKLCVDLKRKRGLSFSCPPISKRLCRNLASEFCSETEPSEPSLDLWVLKTLGLKDKDTIDTTTLNDPNCYPPSEEASSSRCDAHLSPVTADILHTGLETQDTDDSGFENSCQEFLTNQEYHSPCCHSRNSYSNSRSPETVFTTNISPTVQQKDLQNCPMPLQTTINYSPLNRLHFSCSTPRTDQTVREVQGPSKSPCDPGTPTCRSDLAFSMSLSANHSVKTHSFPHGQAFVRRDTQGRCNFTWVPRELP